jgi:hypothetical protein
MEFTKGQKVYVASSDSRQKGFNAVVTSIGSKYITVTDEYTRKYKFYKYNLCCVDWSIYHLEESVDSYERRKLQEHKLFVIRRNEYRLGKILLESEIDDIYNRIVQKFGEK